MRGDLLWTWFAVLITVTDNAKMCRGSKGVIDLSKPVSHTGLDEIPREQSSSEARQRLTAGP